MHLILTYFDTITGPTPFISLPGEISKAKSSVLEGLMDLNSGEGFFEHQNRKEKLSIANYFFEIPSKWARGSVEMLMLSLITDEGQKPNVFEKILTNCGTKFKKESRIYKGFYINTGKTDSETKKFYKIIEKLCKSCYEDCRRHPEGQKPGKMLILGLQTVGKTSIINRLNSNSFNNNIKPTLGTQIVKSVIDKFNFRIYDVGGQEKLRKTWFKSPPPNAIIFVFDCSTDSKQEKEAKFEFDRMIETYFSKKSTQKLPKNTPILILGNKVDLKEDFSIKHLEKILKIKKMGINYKIVLCSALKNTGIEESFKWLVKEFLFTETF